jgi:hypothetical protein
MSEPAAAEHTGPSLQHIVQLFDSTDSRADSVAAFVREGLTGGDTVLVVMTQEQWNLVAVRLRREGLTLDAAVASGRLIVRDAPGTMKGFMRYGVPDPVLFEDVVGRHVRQLASGQARLRIYGEIVDLLAAEGHFEAAHQLEALWNGLGTQAPFTVFCGYSAMNFVNPATADALQSICRAHSHVRWNPADTLGTYLLEFGCADAS